LSGAKGATITLVNIEAISGELSGLFGSGRERPRLTDSYPDLDLPTAYRIGAAVRRRREARGDAWVGRKIGFTNFHMWEAYDVKAPIWGPMYESSVRSSGGFALAGLPSPKIEPEIVFGLGAAPRPGMDERELLDCVEWISLGFELVSSIYPEWKFKAADAIAAFGVHAALVTGSRVPVGDASDWIERLARFEVKLSRNGEVVANGRGSDVLGSPLSALRHLNELVADPAYGPLLGAGEIITTGTLAMALPVEPGETWTADPSGIEMPSVSVRTT
jgi:2-oxo-3-hexenedioate decarboxylase